MARHCALVMHNYYNAASLTWNPQLGGLHSGSECSADVVKKGVNGLILNELFYMDNVHSQMDTQSCQAGRSVCTLQMNLGAVDKIL